MTEAAGAGLGSLTRRYRPDSNLSRSGSGGSGVHLLVWILPPGFTNPLLGLIGGVSFAACSGGPGHSSDAWYDAGGSPLLPGRRGILRRQRRWRVQPSALPPGPCSVQTACSILIATGPFCGNPHLPVGVSGAGESAGFDENVCECTRSRWVWRRGEPRECRGSADVVQRRPWLHRRRLRRRRAVIATPSSRQTTSSSHHRRRESSDDVEES